LIWEGIGIRERELVFCPDASGTMVKTRMQRNARRIGLRSFTKLLLDEDETSKPRKSYTKREADMSVLG
jgi:hypothetical protein